MIGHGKFLLNGDLNIYADELIEDIELKHTDPVVGIGHSIGGAVTFLAATKRPDLFKNLILLDPVVFSATKRCVLSALRKLGLIGYVGPANATFKRRLKFQSLEAAHIHFSSKPLFKDFDPRCFQAYIKHGFVPTEEGVELAFDRQVEGDIFLTPLLNLPKDAKSMRGTLVYGSRSDTFQAMDAKWWRKHMPNFDLMEVEGGHLFPLEQPDATVELINTINRNGV